MSSRGKVGRPSKNLGGKKVINVRECVYDQFICYAENLRQERDVSDISHNDALEQLLRA